MSNYYGASKMWYDLDYDDELRAGALWNTFCSLRSIQQERVRLGHQYEYMYERENFFHSPGVPTAPFGATINMDNPSMITFNAMQIAFDTLCSKMEQASSKVTFQTNGGNWEDRQKAIQLTKLTAGEFYRLKFYALKASIWLDALLHGYGLLKIGHDHKTHKLTFERVHPTDTTYDEMEARDLPPLTMYMTRVVSKSILCAMYPDMENEINGATLTNDAQEYAVRGMDLNGSCSVVEAWRLPTQEGQGDGMHCLAISTGMLEKSEWTRMHFPFARVNWCKKRRGPYCVSAASQVYQLQRYIDNLSQREHDCIYLLSAPYILTDEAQQLNADQFESAGVGNVIQYTNTGAPAPAIITSKVVPDDIRVSKQQYIEQLFAILGINSLESQGNAPSGIDSAPAMEQYTVQAGLRHIKTINEDQRFTLEAAEYMLDELKYIKDTYGEYVAFGKDKDKIEKINFEDADLPPDAFVVQLANANLLPDTPAGRMQAVERLMATGMFKPDEGIRLLQSPDIDAAMNDKDSAVQDIEWTIWEMTRKGGRYLPPEESQDLTSGVEKVTNAYNMCRRENAPDEVLERLAMWKDNASAILQQQQQALQQQQMQQQAQMQQMQLQAQQATVDMQTKADMQKKQFDLQQQQQQQPAQIAPQG